MTRKLALSLVCVAVFVGAVAAPASASASASASAFEDADAEQHCIAFVDDGTVVCAATPELADAAFAAETGYVTVEDELPDGSARMLLVYSLATLYEAVGYGGSSYTFVRSTDCDGSTVSGISDLSTVGLNNSISSFLAYRSCTVRLWDGTGYTGSAYGYTTSKTSLPTFNNIASSARVR